MSCTSPTQIFQGDHDLILHMVSMKRHWVIKGSQLPKMQKYIPDLPLP